LKEKSKKAADVVDGLHELILPNRSKFAEDPFGYSAFALHRWELARAISGFPVDLEAAPDSDEFKSPVLWLAHAHAMSEAAKIVLSAEPTFDTMPDLLKGVCDSQYCAAGLMLVGYSLEICLKAMLIIQKGVPQYSEDEKSHRHHRLEELAYFVPDLTSKDRAILRTLTQFVIWAGRYPDPGSERSERVEEIFSNSEQFQICARDLFGLAARVMGHAKHLVR
jgi:hypothetical protein